MKKFQKLETLGALVLCNILSGGCGGSDSGALGETPMLMGQIESWTMGTGYSVAMKLSKSKTFGAVVATGMLDEKGTFSLVMPSSDELAPQLREPEPLIDSAACKKTPTADPPQLQMVPAFFTASKPGLGELPLNLRSRGPSAAMPGIVSISFTYSDRIASIVGEVDCGEGSSAVGGQTNMQLVRGWNVVISTLKEYVVAPDRVRVISEIHTGPLPADVAWQVESPASF